MVRKGIDPTRFGSNETPYSAFCMAHSVESRWASAICSGVISPMPSGSVRRFAASAREVCRLAWHGRLATGADRGELVGLNWHRHVDRDRRLLILPRAKTNVGRTIPYAKNATIKRILSEAWRVRHPSGAVFLRDGQPVRHEAVKTAMRRAWAAALGSHPKPWKTLRATFATRASERGVDVPTLAALMGLTSAHVLEHYVKPSGRHLADAMADHAACDRLRVPA